MSLTASGKNGSIIGDFCYLVWHMDRRGLQPWRIKKKGAVKKSLNEDRLSSILKVVRYGGEAEAAEKIFTLLLSTMPCGV